MSSGMRHRAVYKIYVDDGGNKFLWNFDTSTRLHDFISKTRVILVNDRYETSNKLYKYFAIGYSRFEKDKNWHIAGVANHISVGDF